jgi:hypothetical protein
MGNIKVAQKAIGNWLIYRKIRLNLKSCFIDRQPIQ